MNKDNLFNQLSKSLTIPLSGFGISAENVSAHISRNLKNPIGHSSSQKALTRLYGSEQEFMANYQNFEQAYKISLAKELDSTAIGASQRRMIQAAIDAPVVNLNLIRNVSERNNLKDLLRTNVLNLEGLVKNFGAPGIPLPSSNLFRASSRYLVDQRGGAVHPAVSLINSLTMNINPEKAGIDAFSFGVSNLPSSSALSQSFETSRRLLSSTGKLFDTTKPVKIFTFDVETSGLGIYDQVRSLAASTMTLEDGKFNRNNADGFSTHFLTPQMQQYTMRDASGKTSRLGSFVYGIESLKDKDGTMLDTLVDLNTTQGRMQAVDQYKDFLRRATDADIIAGHNIQFDIQRTNMSIAGLPEFFKDKEAVSLLKKFNQMSEKGQVMDTLSIARDYLMNQLVDRIEVQGLDEVAIAQKTLIQMIAPENLLRVATGGSVTPFAVGNIASQTNLLTLIERQGDEGAKFIANLAEGTSAAHQANSDVILTEFMMRFIHTKDLQYGFDSMGTPSSQVSAARETISKSSAIVTTTNIADTRLMSDTMYRYVKSEKGLEKVSIMTENNKLLRYSRSDKAFAEYVLDEVTGQTTRIDPRLPNAIAQDEARNLILNAVEQSRKGSKSDLLDVGITYLQSSRTESILDNIAKTKQVPGIFSQQYMIDALRSGQNVVAENQFIDALSSTREFLGFSSYEYRPDIIYNTGMSRLMPEVRGAVDQPAIDNYLTKLTKGGMFSFEDPYLRRMSVELATITSAVPFMDEVQYLADQDKFVGGGIGKNIISRIIESKKGTPEQIDVSPTQFAQRVSEFNSNVGRQIGGYLSELGISFVGAQKANFLISESDTVSKPILSTELLKNIQVTVNNAQTGKAEKVNFLSKEFLSNYERNIFGLSIAETSEGKIVNLVYGNLAADASKGQRAIGARLATELSQGIMDQLTILTAGKNAESLVEEGAFKTEGQAQKVIDMLRKNSRQEKRQFRKEIARSLMDRGVVAGTQTGREAEGMIALIEHYGGGINNEVTAMQNGMSFAVIEASDDVVSMQLRADETALRVMEAEGGEAAEAARRVRSGEILEQNMELYNTTMQRATEDVSFRTRLRRSFSQKRLDKGIGGTSIARGARDARVREVYRKVGPKVGVGAAAVGLLSAGYYIAKKNRESDLYDQVMEEQPTEGKGNTSSTNYSLIDGNQQYSARRDPLVTAGVVGNLDRNKIGHTGMGPNKYDHLYR
jgi:hypothetical protein